MPEQIIKRIAPSYGFELSADQMGGGKFKKSFRLCFDFAAFARIKERTGVELWNNLGQWSRADSSTVLPEIFWASILRHHPEYDSEDGLDAVRSYIDASTAGQIADAVFEAYIVTLPEKTAKDLREKLEKARKGIEAEDPTPAPASEQAPSA